MNRRSLLASVGAVAASGLAGCVDDNGGGGAVDENGTTGNETDTGENDTGGTETEIGEAETTLTDASLTVVNAECGQDHDEAQISFEHDGGDVVVTGTIWGSDACEKPSLGGANYDAEDDELLLTVTASRPDDNDEMGCADCITELDYEVTAGFDGGLPGSVTVRHDHGDGGDVVTTKSSS